MTKVYYTLSQPTTVAHCSSSHPMVHRTEFSFTDTNTIMLTNSVQYYLFSEFIIGRKHDVVQSQQSVHNTNDRSQQLTDTLSTPRVTFRHHLIYF